MIEVFDLRLKRRGFFYGYNNSINPMAASSFGTAAFRFGHSLIPKNLNRCNRFHQLLPYSKFDQKMNFWFIINIQLNSFKKKRNTFEEGIDGSHSYSQPAMRRDEDIVDELTNHLFQTSSKYF